MLEAQFIQASVDFQLKGVIDQPLKQSDAARTRALEGSSGSALAWNTAEAAPFSDNDWFLRGGKLRNKNSFVNVDKAGGALETLLAAGARSNLVIDMQDRRLRETWLPDGALQPVFTFNREIGSKGRVLWPLPTYNDIGSAEFLGPFDWTLVPWSEKQDRVVWRGIHGGRADKHGDVRREGLRLKPLIKKYEKGEMSEAQACAELNFFPRHKLLARYKDDPRFDVGFTGSIQGIPIENYPFIRPLVKPRLTRQEMLRSKYLLVLRGADVGSSFYWSLMSGSLPLVMDCYFETFASGHFRPWEHYVPFKADLSDLEEKLDWCRSNDDACEAMTIEAQKICALVARADLRQEIERLIVARLDARIEQSGS